MAQTHLLFNSLEYETHKHYSVLVIYSLTKMRLNVQLVVLLLLLCQWSVFIFLWLSVWCDSNFEYSRAAVYSRIRIEMIVSTNRFTFIYIPLSAASWSACTVQWPRRRISLFSMPELGEIFFSQLCAMSFHKAATIFIKFFFLVFFPWNSCVVTVPAMGPKSLRFCINFMEIVINDASTAWRLARILLLYMIYLSMRVFYSEFFDDDFQLKPKIVGKHPDKINTFYCRIYQLNILFPKCYWNIENDWKYWKWWKTIEITK